MKVLLVIGNVTFHHLVKEELTLFKNPNAQRKALVHEIECIVECENKEEAEILGEEALCVCCESYIIPKEFEAEHTNSDGTKIKAEIVYECENKLLPITTADFRKDYLS